MKIPRSSLKVLWNFRQIICCIHALVFSSEKQKNKTYLQHEDFFFNFFFGGEGECLPVENATRLNQNIWFCEIKYLCGQY